MKYDRETIKQLKENSGRYLALGLGLILFGILSMYYSFATISIYYLSAFLVILGIVEIVNSFKIKKWKIFLLYLFLGILYIVGGVFVGNPFATIGFDFANFTFVFSIFFFVRGIEKFISSLIQNVPHKRLLLLNVAVDLLFGILILAQWPYSSSTPDLYLWVIGLFVGVDMIITGWSWVWLSMLANRLRA
ncbi:DUF308 domain-containing protein [Candidatus Dependentiae bacterium]|nr:DUF308 domain-containing protein [Candidatus Dependentiae bacterium]